MVTTKIHTPQQVQAILDEVKSQTDRGAAIVSAAVLDDILRMLILARFIELSVTRKEALFDRINAPLSSFSARIEVAFATGIFSNDARVALHFVRKIRNAFAHRIEQITFDHPEIKKLTDEQMPKSVKGGSYRDEFIKLFHRLAAFLYGALAADIRIKSLKETHGMHFLAMALATSQRSPVASAAGIAARSQAKSKQKP
jgi:hypothetical protein